MPTTSCKNQLGFVDPEQFLKTNQSSNDDTNNDDDDDDNDDDSSGSGGLNFYTIMGLLLLLWVRLFGMKNRMCRSTK
jgi:hypothetical protein